MRRPLDRILALLQQERDAFQKLAAHLRTQRSTYAAGRGKELTTAAAELVTLEAPRAAATGALGLALAELATSLGHPGLAPRALKQVLGLLPPRDRARLQSAAAATRAAAEAARLELAVGERLLQFAGTVQEDWLRDLLSSIQDLPVAGILDVKG